MDDVVDPGTFWQLQSVRHRSDTLQHLERPGVMRAKLAAAARRQSLGRSV